MEETNKTPFISVIIPCRNEDKHIAACLESVIANDYPKDRLEILVVDGMSTDGTRQIIDAYAKENNYIKRLDNPRKITPAALNTGIALAKGEVIMRMDAHSVYPQNYISGLSRWLMDSGADNVGGLWHTKPADDSPKSKAIAIALSHPFGVGNAHYRIGSSKPRWVDTVPFGCFKKEVFERIGMFDEEMIRNQDDEFNHRLIKNGGRILLVPDIVISYHARDSLSKVWWMNYQYGYFKPLVARKVRGILTARQLIPSLFILSLGIFGILSLWKYYFGIAGSLIFLAYILAALYFSISISFKQGLKCGLLAIFVFPVIHFAYGFGYLKGVLDFFLFYQKRDLSTMPITR